MDYLEFAYGARLSIQLALNANYLQHAPKRFAQNAIGFDNWRMEIGQVIRALRLEKRETLEQMAHEIGTDPSNLSRIERGVQQPAAASLKMIAAALHTTVAALHAHAEGVGQASKKGRDLLGSDAADYTTEAIQLRRNFRALSPENKHLAVEFVKLLNRTQSGR